MLTTATKKIKLCFNLLLNKKFKKFKIKNKILETIYQNRK